MVDAVGIACSSFPWCAPPLSRLLKGTEDVLGKGEPMLAQMVTTCVVMLPACLIFDRSLAVLTQLDTRRRSLPRSGDRRVPGGERDADHGDAPARRIQSLREQLVAPRLRVRRLGFVLDEPITNVLQWAGLAMIIFALITYWRLRNPGVVHTTGTPTQATIALVHVSEGDDDSLHSMLQEARPRVYTSHEMHRQCR